MASSLALLCLLVAALAVTAIESRAVSGNPHMPMMLPVYNAPSYPPRTLMFTSFYRPSRQSTTGNDAQASGIYAQGNTVGGGAFFQQPESTKILTEEGPEPADEPEIAISEAVASPQRPGSVSADEEQYDQPERVALNLPEDNTDVKSNVPVNDEPTAAEEEEPTPTRKSVPKKNTKKIPIADPEDDEEYDDDEEIEAPVDFPFRPPNKNRKNKPYSFNNFFPVVFTFPAGAASRRGSSSGGSSSGSPNNDMPGFITAIANSYSTTKGGVASSVATAYGATPTKKQRRTSATTN